MEYTLEIDWTKIKDGDIREVFRRLAQLTTEFGRWDGRPLRVTIDVKAHENFGRLNCFDLIFPFKFTRR